MVLTMAESGKNNALCNSSPHPLPSSPQIWQELVNTKKLKHFAIMWFSRFDNVRIPRENLLNSVANVSPDGQYLSAIKNPDQVSTSTELKSSSPCCAHRQ